MQEIKLETIKRMIGTIKDQPIGDLSEKQIERYCKKEFGKVLQPYEEFKRHKKAKNFFQVREEFSIKSLIELLGEDLFKEVFVNPVNQSEKKIKATDDDEFFSPEDEFNVELMEFDRFDRRRLDRRGNYCVNKNNAIVLFASLQMQRKTIGVLKLEGSKADIAKQAKDMIDTSATSQYVSIDPLEIADALDYCQKFGDSTVANAEGTFTNLNNALQSILFQFQNFANSNPTIASLVFTSGGFGTKTITPRKNQEWGAKNTKNEGTIKLKAEGSRLRSAHDWWISLDGKTFTRLCPTTAAETLVKGLATGLEVFFMHQLITKDGPQGFENVVKLTVSTL